MCPAYSCPDDSGFNLRDVMKQHKRLLFSIRCEHKQKPKATHEECNKKTKLKKEATNHVLFQLSKSDLSIL